MIFFFTSHPICQNLIFACQLMCNLYLCKLLHVKCQKLAKTLSKIHTVCKCNRWSHVGFLRVCLYGIGVYSSINSSEMISNFPAILNFNRLFLKLNRLVHLLLTASSPRSLVRQHWTLILAKLSSG